MISNKYLILLFFVVSCLDARRLPCDSKSRQFMEFFMLLGKLKHLPRTGWLIRGIDRGESVADHMYRMAVMSFLLERDESHPLNRDKCIKMALLHDMPECIVGDLTPYSGVSVEEKHRRESEALDKMCALVDDETRQEMTELYKEYEKRETPEAKAVKDLDRFDLIFQAYEYERAYPGKSLQELFDYVEGEFTHPQVKKWVETLYEMRSSNRSDAGNCPPS